ncbi:MAG: hydroxylamine reductase [Candidatus Krumholzibacteriota bacterium]|nr:hydroxylamine reductase [Candidatus Krumholzibacteriota bacterium]
MFCFQCQETAKNSGCTVRGVCGKSEQTSHYQDLLIYTLKGISIYGVKAAEKGDSLTKAGRFITSSLFATITNANFDDEIFKSLIKKGLEIRDDLASRYGSDAGDDLHDAATWKPGPGKGMEDKAIETGVPLTGDEDQRSLRELLVYGLKGISAYAHHAEVLGHEDEKIYAFIMEALASTTMELSLDDMVAMVMKSGSMAVETMALLDKANSTTYGNPEITVVDTGVRTNPGILISGHDLKDLDELLKQTEGSGVDIYTHSEMLPANYYPAFKKYGHLAGNYGNAWWKQNTEFESFNGPILMTTNCITPVQDSYRERIFTTGMAGYPGIRHIPDRKDGNPKDFSEIIELAKRSKPPVELENGKITGGFAHNQVMALADKVVDAVKSGAISRFVVMAGCDGRQKGRNYFSEVAAGLPDDTVILTAGCAKYRYNKLDLGDIGGIPRVLDAGQCNDSYSLAVIALKLKEVFGLDDINDLPISFDIAWYEQKAVAVLLALLSLGVKGIRLGPTLPAFLSPNVVKVLVDNFDIKPTGDAEEDIASIVRGE